MLGTATNANSPGEQSLSCGGGVLDRHKAKTSDIKIYRGTEDPHQTSLSLLGGTERCLLQVKAATY